jgi:subtilase family serine protease
VVVATANPTDLLNASITTNLAAGGYFIRILGTGKGVVTGTGYSNYGSIGAYTLAGTIPGGRSGPPVITSPDSVTTEINVALSYQITATNDPDSYAITGTLPQGVTFNPTTALISGTPTEIGTFPITVSATNPVGVGTKNVSIIVTPTPPPNLHPTKPTGWDDQIVVSTAIGTHTNNSPIESDDPLFFDFAVTNDGSLPTEQAFACDLLIDGQLRATFTIPAPFNVGTVTEVNDIDVGTLSVGQHTLTLKIDSGNTVAEITEVDNIYERTINVLIPQLPNLVPFKPASWSDRVVISNVTGTSTDSPALRTDQTLYADVAVVNDGPVTASTTFTTQVFLDGQLHTTFTTNPPLATNIVGFLTDINLGQLASGLHTVRVRTDADATISEVSELDNDFLKTFFVEPAGAANLGFFKPNGWSNSVVISRVSGTRTDTPIVTTADNLYVDFTALSNGTLAVNQAWVGKVFVDDVETVSVNFPASLPPNFTVEGTDLTIGQLTAGTHTIRVVLDATSAVGETNETPNDNETIRTVTVVAPPPNPGAASYSGVIRSAPGTSTTLEKFGLANVKVSANGGFTAKVTAGSSKFSVKGSLAGNGESAFGRGAEATASLSRKGGNPLQIDFRVGGEPGKEQLVGELTESGLAFAAFTADRVQNPPANLLGKYTAVFPPKSPGDQGLAANLFPQGFGIGFLTVSNNGVAKMTGTLADGAKFSFSNPIVTGNEWPFHLLVNKGSEIVNGTVTFREQPDISDFDGIDLTWVKLEDLSSPAYSGGWPQGIRLDLLGSKYIRGRSEPALPWLGPITGTGHAEVRLSGAGLTATQVAAVNVDPKGKVTAVNSAIPGLKMNISSKTGALTGEFQHPVTGAKTKIYGAAFDAQKFANGFFLSGGESGPQTLTPKP